MTICPLLHTDHTIFDYTSYLDGSIASLPFSLRVLAENAARLDPGSVQMVQARQGEAVSFRPARLLLQDMLGLPLLVDMMAMRSALADQGGDASKVDMSLPVDLVIDHSMTINSLGGEAGVDQEYGL